MQELLSGQKLHMFVWKQLLATNFPNPDVDNQEVKKGAHLIFELSDFQDFHFS